MDQIGLAHLSKMIYEHCGIDYRKQEATLSSKIASRLRELGLTSSEYATYLKTKDTEWDKLIELITVNETYFFREDKVLEEFQKLLLQYQNRSVHQPLRIWSAACSSGEEPYTLAMLIKEKALFPPGAVQIIASDINPKILQKAKSGLYHKKSLSFRKMPDTMLRKYFLPQEEEYQIINEVKEMIEFRRLNLFDPYLVGKMEKIDILFCRNVLIYFDGKAIQKIVNSFADIMKPGGYLFLGHAETITGTSRAFETIYQSSVFYYRRKGECP
ncbi:CheR family methyltransferase [Heliorestis convoluta]|uniref:protein-glutamate O-methyltransferase n=1 Tax=Heliorestis convoluta TaxID=356322 RepID=A0A5Q2N018_9FIRM|nr:protein-glutamate O-methyltransferase CheR [Heliorestis convoluta]QGG48614.1 protein-glutamate O-methyltransferase [Heliorestis convoluta]